MAGRKYCLCNCHDRSLSKAMGVSHDPHENCLECQRALVKEAEELATEIAARIVERFCEKSSPAKPRRVRGMVVLPLKGERNPCRKCRVCLAAAKVRKQIEQRRED